MFDFLDDILAPDDFGENKTPTNVLIVGQVAKSSAELTKLARYIEGHPMRVVFVEENGAEFIVEKSTGVSRRIN